VGVPNQRRADPASSFQRFRSLPVPIIIDCLNAIYALHEELALLGWIANDFYDGCLIYNFTTGQLTVMVVLLPSPV
jgi:serine/threonine-protein kinase